jgi:alpha-mannosidase
MDQGVSSFVVRLRSGAEISRREVQVMADELTKPPVVTTHVARHGAGAHVGTWLDLGVGENVVVTTLKTAEDTDDVIVRALELDGRPGQVGGVALHPRRIATLRLRGDELLATDGLESGGQ